MGLDRPVDITADQRKTLLALLERHLPNTAAWVYGSRVKWTSRPQSDLDLVVFATPEQERRVSDLREAFEESSLPFRVDLFVWDSVPEQFRKQIEADHVVLVEREERGAVDGWIDATIDDIAASSRNALVGGPFGSNLVSRDYVSEGVPVIRGQNMGTRWVTGDFVFVTPQKAESLEANLARPGDIVLTQRGTLGQVSIVPSTSFGRYLVSQSQMKVTVNREIADPLFFYYVLSSTEQQDYVRQNAIQTGVPHTNLGILRSTPVPIPPLSEQRAIAHILGTLDDKIELNRRMNETLEAMARALFKSWFVDFDPVRAKMEGRDPGLPRHLADLFPHRLVGSELGDIPEGWGVKTLGDLCDKPQYGYTASAQAEGVGPKFLRITDINKMPWIDWNSVPYCIISEPDRVKYSVRRGDILIARMADPGHGVMVEENVDAVFASYLIRFRPQDNCNARLLQYWLRADDYWEMVNRRGAGTTRTSLNAKVLSELPLIVPPYVVAGEFSNIINRSRSCVVANVSESMTLAALRDTLLPKLVSGDFSVVEFS